MRRSLGGPPPPLGHEQARERARRRVAEMVVELQEEGEGAARQWLERELRALEAPEPSTSSHWRAYREETSEACRQELARLGDSERRERVATGLPLFEEVRNG